jgi:hypothetical protein
MQGTGGLLEHAWGSGLYVWQYCKHPPTAKPPASKTAEQAHAAAPSHPAATVAASDDAAAPGTPSLPESLHWLPGPVPCDAASAALLKQWPGDAEHKTYALYSLLQGYEPDLSLAQMQRACASPEAVAAAGQVAQKANQGGARALRAMYVRATVQCHECDKLRAVYCKQPLRKLEKLHAGRRSVVPDDNGSDSDGNACIHADADGAAAAGSSGNAPESTQPQAQSSGAPSKHATRRCSQRAAAAAASASMVQDATDSDSPQSASESDVTQDDADLDAHADSVSNA